MSDKVVKSAHVLSTERHRLIVQRRSAGDVWAYVELAPPVLFSTDQKVQLRVDKWPVREHGQEDNETAKFIKKTFWEWSPNVVGFLIWHGSPAEGCGYIHQLAKGKTAVVRFWPNQMQTVDIRFNLGDAKGLLDALDLKLKDCTDSAPAMGDK